MRRAGKKVSAFTTHIHTPFSHNNTSLWRFLNLTLFELQQRVMFEVS